MAEYDPNEFFGAERKMTNGDRIRAMSDEELAGYLTERFLLARPDDIRTDVDVAKECYNSALDWLKQEVDT